MENCSTVFLASPAAVRGGGVDLLLQFCRGVVPSGDNFKICLLYLGTYGGLAREMENVLPLMWGKLILDIGLPCTKALLDGSCQVARPVVVSCR